MTCPKNKKLKKILWWNVEVEGEHKWEVHMIERLQWWTITYRCEICGCKKEEWPLNDEDVLRRFGFLPELGFLGLIFSEDFEEQKNKIKL